MFQSFYFAVLTLTTAGYGDFASQTTAGRPAAIFRVLVGLGIVVALVTRIATHAAAAHTAARERRKGGTGPSAQPPSG
ncbi:MAG: potassium channel family protein [Actinomycetota bacterium]